MADLVIVAGNVLKGSQSGDETVVAGETIVRGDSCYLDPQAQNKAKLTNATAVASSKFKGIALNDATVDQPVTLWTSGNLAVGVILTISIVYVLSENSGKLKPIGELNSSESVTLVAVASTTSNMQAIFHETGVVKP